MRASSFFGLVVLMVVSPSKAYYSFVAGKFLAGV